MKVKDSNQILQKMLQIPLFYWQILQFLSRRKPQHSKKPLEIIVGRLMNPPRGPVPNHLPHDFEGKSCLGVMCLECITYLE